MLSDNFEEMGVGYYDLADDSGGVNYRHYWTQVFGTEATHSCNSLFIRGKCRFAEQYPGHYNRLDRGFPPVHTRATCARLGGSR